MYVLTSASTNAQLTLDGTMELPIVIMQFTFDFVKAPGRSFLQWIRILKIHRNRAVKIYYESYRYIYHILNNKCLMILLYIYMQELDPFIKIVISETIVFINLKSKFQTHDTHLCVWDFWKRSKIISFKLIPIAFHPC